MKSGRWKSPQRMPVPLVAPIGPLTPCGSMAPGTPCGPRIEPVFAQEVICSADRSHELLPLMIPVIPGLPAPRRLPWPAADPAGGRPSETRWPSRVTAARSAISSVSPVQRFGQGDRRNPDRKQGSGFHPSHHPRLELAWRSSTPHPDLPSGAVSVCGDCR
jgi:hypothetical protein